MTIPKIDKSKMTIDPKIAKFDLFEPDSSNIEFVGTNGIDEIVIQFHSGSTYLYVGIDQSVLDKLKTQTNWTGFVHKVLKPYIFLKHMKKLIVYKDSVLSL